MNSGPDSLPPVPTAADLLTSPAHVVRERLLCACPSPYRPAFSDAIDAAHIHCHRLAIPLLLLELQRIRSTDSVCNKLVAAAGALSMAAGQAATALASQPKLSEINLTGRIPDDQIEEIRRVIVAEARLPSEVIKIGFDHQTAITSIIQVLRGATKRNRIVIGVAILFVLLQIAILLK